MTADATIQRQDAVPFQPYWIMLADGREIPVDHPDFASVSESDDSITIFDNTGGVEIDDLALVVSLRYGGAPKKFQKAR